MDYDKKWAAIIVYPKIILITVQDLCLNYDLWDYGMGYDKK